MPKPKAFGASFAASPAEISVLVSTMTALLLFWAEDMELTLKKASMFFRDCDLDDSPLLIDLRQKNIRSRQ